MEGSLTSELKTQLPEQPDPESHAAKKGKALHQTVVKVKVIASGGKQKNEGPPSDSWSWRKYGQKPIKGTPYPRGYYRCSTSKGCSAKKQVERCRTDASMLIITYTSTHNHPGPNIRISINLNSPNPPKLKQPQAAGGQTSMYGEETTSAMEEQFHYFEPPQDVTSHIDHNLFSVDLIDGAHLFDEDPISYPPISTSPKPESDEYDFFNELEELPMSSPFKSFYGERILVQPS